MRNRFKRAYRRYRLRGHAIPFQTWTQATAELPLLQGLTPIELARLRVMSSLFLREKNLVGVDIDLNTNMRIVIAAQCCLPVLYLGLALLYGWLDVVVYPDAFVVAHEDVDDAGVVHQEQRILTGEAWSAGPLILSWQEILEDIEYPESGQNVIVHEIAHKLDMRNGVGNGMPPLHADMSVTEWTTALSAAFRQLRQYPELPISSWIDPYAATDPAECFAVFSEAFFCTPAILLEHCPAVFRQLSLYYRQQPHRRRDRQLNIDHR
ncbi:zinc-dependent peptidase [Methylomonas sp. CM2]|uniref:M90 family metallopeptidase n=1 Tax=Methylomonas sp. CM2 TaxID=3417647 RepID=UPI003CEF05B9